ncbi:tyrosine--tRNA ligase, mitochondrial isoform X2 [Ischnura elegans]|uniref:tyrosine--tRNA ligase, mitochondrial isoform X2 n=1 Tax=Ischnura elegans TaxID=197161 RepID=UPI001ED86C4D|nr:tyrosine--tRNA ligase, mitochondrial isoform X2 [Ischnura elegans]
MAVLKRFACFHQVTVWHKFMLRTYSSRNILALSERGFLQDIFPSNSAAEIIDVLNSHPQVVYAGFDPTADSLHVGGATAQIGDPSGRSSERPKLAVETVERNKSSISECIKSLFDNHEKYFWLKESQKKKLQKVIIVDNERFYRDMSVIDFVSHIGCHFRVGPMLSKSMVQSRLSSDVGLSFSELAYQTFQAYDWLHLLRNYNCRFQIGGSDQMGNIVAGHDLIGRVVDTKVYGLTVPIVTSETGDKFGKSAGNAVWLSNQKTSSFELYQYLVRTPDADVEKMLKFFTFDSLSNIEQLMKKHKANPELWLAQKKLADSVTLLVHGEQGLKSAHLATSALYDKDLESLACLTSDDIRLIFRGAAKSQLLLSPGMTTLNLAMSAGCFGNESDAKRIISAGGFYINHKRVTNYNEILTKAVHILPNNISLVRVGKRNYYIVQWLT